MTDATEKAALAALQLRAQQELTAFGGLTHATGASCLAWLATLAGNPATEARRRLKTPWKRPRAVADSPAGDVQPSAHPPELEVFEQMMGRLAQGSAINELVHDLALAGTLGTRFVAREGILHQQLQVSVGAGKLSEAEMGMVLSAATRPVRHFSTQAARLAQRLVLAARLPGCHEVAATLNQEAFDREQQELAALAERALARVAPGKVRTTMRPVPRPGEA